MPSCVSTNNSIIFLLDVIMSVNSNSINLVTTFFLSAVLSVLKDSKTSNFCFKKYTQVLLKNIYKEKEVVTFTKRVWLDLTKNVCVNKIQQLFCSWVWIFWKGFSELLPLYASLIFFLDSNSSPPKLGCPNQRCQSHSIKNWFH